MSCLSLNGGGVTGGRAVGSGQGVREDGSGFMRVRLVIELEIQAHYRL